MQKQRPAPKTLLFDKEQHMHRLIITVTLLMVLAPIGTHAQTPISIENDVIYSRTNGSAVLADIAYPVNGADLPAIIYVHGGRWRAGERDYANALDIAQWAGMGYFSMTIDYRLVGATPAPAAYQDLQTAIRWVHAHADEYGIDTDSIYLIGDSSGGHLVALAATLGEGPYERVGGWEEARSDIRAAISVAGPYELNTLSWGNLWTPIEGDPLEARRLASPIHSIGPGTRPLLVIHSDDDRSVPIQQAIDFVTALNAAGVQHDFIHYTDSGHMRITEDVIRETLAFIARLESQ
jgi:acetyl esterase/lipase